MSNLDLSQLVSVEIYLKEKVFFSILVISSRELIPDLMKCICSLDGDGELKYITTL